MRSIRTACPRRSTSRATPKQRVELVEQASRAASSGTGGPPSARAERHAAPATRLPVGSQAYGAAAVRALARAAARRSRSRSSSQLVDDGIYITRLHYLGIVNPREGVVTGMTRDGTFRIRDGKIAEPLVNLRFTVAVPDVLAERARASRAA